MSNEQGLTAASEDGACEEKYYLAFRAGTGRVQIQHSNKMLITYSHTGWYSNANAGVDFENLEESENSGIAEKGNEIPQSLFDSTLKFINTNINDVLSGISGGVVASCNEFALEQILAGNGHDWKEIVADFGNPRSSAYATEQEWEVARSEGRAVTIVWVGGDSEYLGIVGQFPDSSSRLIFDKSLPFTEGWLTGYDEEDVVEEYSEEKAMQGNVTEQLFTAIEAGDNDTVLSCIQNGADLDEQSEDHDGRTPLLLSVEIGNATVVQSIASAAQDLELAHYSDRLSPWLKARVTGKTEIANVLAKCGAEVKLKDALNYAIEHDDLEMAKAFLAEGAHVDGKEEGWSFGDPPIILAAQHGRLEISKLLMESGADIHNADDGETPYVKAFSNSHFELADFFKDSGCTVDSGYALIYSAGTGNLEAVEKALGLGADIHSRRSMSHSTSTAIERAVTSSDYPDDDRNSNALRKKVLSFLVEQGADPNCVNEGKPLLHLAIEDSYEWDIPGFLLKLGAKLDVENAEDGQSTLFAVARKNNAKMLFGYVLSGGEVTGVDADGRSPIHLHIQEESYLDASYIKTLLGTGADVTLTDNSGATISELLSKKREELEDDYAIEKLDEIQKLFEPENLEALQGILCKKPETGEQYVTKAKLVLELLEDESAGLATIEQGVHEGVELSVALCEHLESDDWQWQNMVLKGLGRVKLAPSTIQQVLHKYEEAYDAEIKSALRPSLEAAGVDLPLIPGELTSLSKENAETLMDALEEEGELDLSGLNELSPEVAEILANGNYYLSLRSVRSLDEGTYNALARLPGTVELGVEQVSETEAIMLAQFKSTLLLSGLTSFDETAGHIQLAKKLAESGRVALPSLTELPMEIATTLVRTGGELELSGITSLSNELAEVLSGYEGEQLALSGLTKISPQVAESLCGVKATLNLDGLQSISPEIARALGKREGVLWLDGLTEIGAESAKALAGTQSQLTLSGLESLSEMVAAALATHNGELLLNQVLTVSDEVSVELSKHKGGLRLQNLENISIEAANHLAGIEGPLELQLEYITPDSSAEILRKHPSFADED